jgi:hypothetical protein
MTAQMWDSVKYEESFFILCAPPCEKVFDPNLLGISSADWTSTHCYRGYACEFEILKKTLSLKTLYLLTKNTQENILQYYKQGIRHFGKPPLYQENIQMVGNAYVFSDVHRIIPYTGKIIIGTDSNRAFMNGGYRHFSEFQTVLKLFLKDGKVLREKDQSAGAERWGEIRERYYQKPIEERYLQGNLKFR